MIPKPSTSEVMNVFNSAVQKAEDLKNDIQDAKTALSSRIDILDKQYNFMMSQLEALTYKTGESIDKIVFADVDKYGEFDSYGITIHPKFIKTPRDLFNFKSTKGYLFKDNVSVTIGSVDSPAIKEALKNDTIAGKSYTIEEFDNPILDITISPNLKAPLGSLLFNMIEISPFLPGSFHIESIDVYSRDNLNLATQSLSYGIQYVGAQRIFFSEKTELGKLVIRVRLLHKNAQGKYLFGLRHLYLQEADYLNTSYVIVRLDKVKNISYIYDTVTLKTQFGTDTELSSTEFGIQYYGSYDGELLDNEIEVSKPTDLNYLAINTKTIFIRIPVITSMIAFTPNVSLETNE